MGVWRFGHSYVMIRKGWNEEKCQWQPDRVRENEVKGSWGRKPHIEETMCSDYNGSIDLHLAVSERG